jgi:hypothetical protein
MSCVVLCPCLLGNGAGGWGNFCSVVNDHLKKERWILYDVEVGAEVMNNGSTDMVSFSCSWSSYCLIKV